MERTKSIVHLSCDPVVLSNVFREATHLETALLLGGKKMELRSDAGIQSRRWDVQRIPGP